MPMTNAVGTLAQFSKSPKLFIYAQGLAQSSAVPVADNIAATVPVPTAIGFYKSYTQKDRFFIPEASRPAGEGGRKIGITAQDNQYSCRPFAYDYPIDRLYEIEEEEMENSVMEGARMIAEMAALYHENYVVTNAVSGITAVNGAASLQQPGLTARVWSTNINDPVADMDQAIKTVLLGAAYGSAMGVKATLGPSAFLNFKNSTLVRGRFIVAQGAPGGSAGQIIPTSQNIGGLMLAEPDVKVSFMVKDTAPPGQPVSMSFLLDTQIIVVASRETPDRRDPSAFKTFRVMGHYMVPRQWVTSDSRGEVVGFDWVETVVTGNTLAAKLLTIS